MTSSNRSFVLLAALAALTLMTSPVGAQAAKKSAKPVVKHETDAQLKAEAKISEADARKTALAQVPGGTVKKYELERENGKLLYSYDITAKGESGVDEVQIDAVTGAVLSNKHETPAQERAEAKAEAKVKKGAKKP